MIEVAHRMGRSVAVGIERGAGLGHWEVTFESEAIPGTLAVFTGVLALHDLDITSAMVELVPGGRVRDAFEVMPVGGLGLGVDSARALAGDAAQGLAGTLDVEEALWQKRTFASGPAAVMRAQVDVDTVSRLTTGITVRATDRVGLLHDVAATLTRHKLRTRALTVLTFGGKALDSFRVVDADGHAPRDHEALQVLRDDLIDVCTRSGYGSMRQGRLGSSLCAG